MKVLVYQSKTGSFQYEVVSLWAKEMTKALISFGHTPLVVPLHTLDQSERFAHAFQEKPALAFGFNGIGLEIDFNGENIHDLLDIPFVGFFLDHPAFHIKRLTKMPRRSHACFVDANNAEFYDLVFPAPMPSSFVPHGGTMASRPDSGIVQEKRKGIAFFGTGGAPDQLHEEWKHSFPRYHSLLNEVVEESMDDSCKGSDLILLEALVEKGYDIGNDELCLLVTAVEHNCRARHRLRILAQLDKEVSSVDIYGNGWDNAEFRHHRIFPSIPYGEALSALSRYRLCLNISCQFREGAHERVFDAALNGAVSVTNESGLMLREFSNDRDCIFYDPRKLVGLSERVATILDNQTLAEHMSSRSRAIVQEGHLWSHRVECGLELLEQM